MMNGRTDDKPNTASMMEDTGRQHTGFYIAVDWARQRSMPLYHIRHRTGTTLDMCVNYATAMASLKDAGKDAQMYKVEKGCQRRVH